MQSNNRWSLVQTVGPVSEPVTATDMRDHMRITTDEQDKWMLRAITAARQLTETIQNRQLMTATWQLIIDFFPSWEIKIPLPPLQSVTSIIYLDTQGNVQTLSSSTYIVSTASQPGRITPAYNLIWPINRYQMEAITITFVAGYANALAIPATTIMPLMGIAADCYERREYNIEKAATNNQMYVDMLMSDRVLDFSGPLGSSSNIPAAVSAWGPGAWMN